ncbi:NEDD8-activating enzyme E1 regulatory subunit [Lamellibrachia satsuma]|nr:NEDD8-activating enzyme E1 regulatory subunit [Lamellibrachia satsuma]
MESGPAEKSKKYDRQLRLWGDHGQAALESAKVCLINATATGTEILKNIILPGIGSFTIVDGHKVSGEDIGNNFFLDKDSIGKSRAQVATELLLELNEDVNGDFIEETVDNLLRNNSGFFQNFHMVIVTDLPEKTLVMLASHLWESDTPLLVCRSYGLIGYMRLVLREHTVVESHPDNAIEDLRLDHPFKTLIEYCNSQNMAEMSKKNSGRRSTMEKFQGIIKKKNKLKEIIREGILKNAELVPEDEENFDEAIRNVNSALVPTKIPDSVKQIMSDDCCLHLQSEAWPLLQPSSKKGVNFAHCQICEIDFSISHGGRDDCRRHIASKRHTDYVALHKPSKPISNFFARRNEKDESD